MRSIFSLEAHSDLLKHARPMAASANTSDGTHLSPEQVAQYNKEGFLHLQSPILPASDFAELKSYADELITALPEGERPEDMDVPHLAHPKLFDWIFHKSILDLVEPITGPDIALFSTHLLCKPASVGKRVPWHQDSFYWSHLLSPMEVVTVWLAIDESGPQNGAMEVIPRTHLQANAEYEDCDLEENTFPRRIKKQFLEEAESYTLTLQPNQASLHAAGLFHGSPPNQGKARRCGFTMRFMSAGVRYNTDAGDYHQIYLARGADRAGNTYGDPSKPRPDLIERRKSRVRRGH